MQIITADIHNFGMKYVPRNWIINNKYCLQRVYYVYSGNASFIGREKEYPLNPGFAYVFPYNLEFSVKFDPDNPFYHLYVDFNTIPPIIAPEPISCRVEEGSLVCQAIKPLAAAVSEYDSLYVRDRFDREINRANSSGNGTRETLNRIVMTYFEGLLLVLSRETDLNFAGDDTVTAALDYIHANYARPLAVGDLSRRACLDVNCFIRKFRKYMNITPYQYIREYRLNNAEKLLAANKTVSEAAYLTGFENASSLSRALKGRRRKT